MPSEGLQPPLLLPLQNLSCAKDVLSIHVTCLLAQHGDFQSFPYLCFEPSCHTYGLATTQVNGPQNLHYTEVLEPPWIFAQASHSRIGSCPRPKARSSAAQTEPGGIFGWFLGKAREIPGFLEVPRASNYISQPGKPSSPK